MSTFVVGHLREVAIGPGNTEYLEEIDATLAEFEGRLLIHGGRPEVLEGDREGDLIVVEFPDRERAEVLIEGVPADDRATDVLAGARS